MSNKEVMPGVSLDRVLPFIRLALKEDQISHDATTTAVIPQGLKGRGWLVAKREGVVAGLKVSEAIYKMVDPRIRFIPLVRDGQKVGPGKKLALVTGNLTALLKTERTALNFIQQLSGVATLAARFVERVKGTHCQILDTRKTLPGLRHLQKAAVKLGGAENHRMSLKEAVLLKDNHLNVIPMADAIRKAKAYFKGRIPVIVEVTRLSQIMPAIRAGASRLILDNMRRTDIRRAVHMAKGKVWLEASGNVSLKNVRSYAKTGVDFISVGRLTHSVHTLDISFELEKTKRNRN